MGFASNLTVSSGVLLNRGLIEVNQGSGGPRALSGSITNEGTLTFNTGLTVSGSLINGPGGLIQGVGTLNLLGATLSNSGGLSPGLSPGLLSVTGGVRQTGTGAVNIEIAGSGASQFDQLAVSGAATLDGTLNLSLVGSFVPNIGDSFDVLTFGARSGAFATINGLGIGSGRHFEANYGSSRLTLQVVPD